MTEENLISPPPRDLILSLRRDALIKADGQRLEHKMKEARQTCDFLLEQFAKGYFFDSRVYGTLKPKEKKELAEICAFACRKQIVLKALPFAVISGIITGLGILNPIILVISFFSVLFLFLFGCMFFAVSDWLQDLILGFTSDFKDCWKFLSARRFLKRLVGEKNIFKE